MYTNNLEIIINAPIKNVWHALTDKEKIKEWMYDTEVETSWKEGSPIKYTCYDPKGNVVTWNGKQVIWDGVVDKVVIQKELTFFYPSMAAGLEKESFHLVEIFPEVTKVSLSQDFLTKEAANLYFGNTRKMLHQLKDFLEIWY